MHTRSLTLCSDKLKHIHSILTSRCLLIFVLPRTPKVSSKIPHSLKAIKIKNLSSNIIKHIIMPKKRSKPKVKEHGKPSQKQLNEVQKSSSSSFFTAVIAILGIILAFIWTHYIKNNDDVLLSLQDLLSMVRRSNSFNLTNSGNRTLLATDDIKSGTILMEIPRDLMM